MKEKRKRLALWMSFVLLAGFGLNTFGTLFAFGISSFSDVTKGQWFEPFVSELAVDGIISGYPDRTFRPSERVTVGQFLAMAIQTGQRIEAIAHAEDSGASGIVNSSEEAEYGTGKHHWARAFYDCARNESLLFDDELPETSLDRPISRQWMAVIAVRMMKATGNEEFETILSSIKDVEEMTPYSYEIVTAYQCGLLSGYPDGTFHPEGYLTRAEAAAVIYKLNETWKETSESGGAEKETEETPEEASGEIPEKLDCGYEKNPADMASGTELFWYRIGSESTEVKKLMKNHVPDLADQLYVNFCEFTERAAVEQSMGKQGLRKEYVGGYPVLMEAIGGEIHVYIKPKGTESRFWEVKPGQVSEEFF